MKRNTSSRPSCVSTALLLKAKSTGPASKKAKEALVKSCEHLLKSIVNRYCKGCNNYNDVLQEAYLSLFAAVASYDPTNSASFSTYAYSVVRNRVIQYNKENSLYCTIHCSSEVIHSNYPNQEAPTQLLDSSIRHLQTGISRLTDKEKSVVELHFFKNMRDVDISKYLGVSKARISILLKSAKLKLKRYFTSKKITQETIYNY